MTNAAVLPETAAAPKTVAMIVRQLRYEAEGVVSVELCARDGSELPPWRPGAHLELVLPTGITRQYSLCGSPQDRSVYRIGVRRDRMSRGGSEYVHAFLRPGQPIQVRGPLDNFRFTEAAAYLFIAGGIGITPILPMLREAENLGVPWQLVYGGHTADSMAFLEELGQHGERVWLYPSDRGGRIPLEDWLREPRADTAIYACGPESLLTGIEEGAQHWAPGSVHLERFKSRPKATSENTEFDVVCARSDRTVTVPADRSVLTALEDEGLPVAGSCREGICGTCETRVLEGTPEHRDDILSEADRAAGDRMFICVSRACDKRLVLDI